MNEQLKQLGLTQLARVLPTLVEQARQQQLSYEAFVRQAVEAEIGGRQQRALERHLRAARLLRRVRLEAFDFSFHPTFSERGPRVGELGVCGDRHQCAVPGATRGGQDPFGECLGTQSAGRGGL